MGKNVVAEGVEHQQQVDVLDGLGVDEYQGFFFSRPLSNEAFSKMLSMHGTAGPAGLPCSTVPVACLKSHAHAGPTLP
jgi:predicted signal transduction protein with EAL and GGDEF domain